MANTILQIKRTTVAGRQPNTTSSSNGQYINPGELAINLTDGILYSSNGSALIAIGASQSSLTACTITATSLNATNVTIDQGISVGNSSVNSSINAIGLFAGNSSINSVINSIFISVSNSVSNSQMSPKIIFSGNSIANAQFNLNAFSQSLTVSTYSYDGSNLTIYTTTNTNFVAPTKGQYVTLSSLPGAAAKFNNTYEVSGIVAANGFTIYTPFAANIASVQRTSGVATIITTSPHGFNTSDPIAVSGIPVDPNYAPLTYNGSYTVTSTPNSNTLTYANFPSITNTISSYWTTGGASNLHFNTTTVHGLSNGMYVNIPSFTDTASISVTGMSFDPFSGSPNAYFSLSSPYLFTGAQAVTLSSSSTNVYSASVSSFKSIGTAPTALSATLTVAMPTAHNLDVGSYIQFNGVTSGAINTTAFSFGGTISGTVLTVNSVPTGVTFAAGQVISGSGVTSGTYITGAGSSPNTYNLSASSTVAVGGTFTASIATTGIMTVTGSPTGIAVGQYLSGTNVPQGTYIASLGTGSGGAGTYNVLPKPGSAVGSTTITRYTPITMSSVSLVYLLNNKIFSIASVPTSTPNSFNITLPTTGGYSYYTTAAVTGTGANAYVQLAANLSLGTASLPTAGSSSDFSGQRQFPYTGASASSNTFVLFNLNSVVGTPYTSAALTTAAGTISLPRWKYLFQGTSFVSGTSTIYGSTWALTTSSFTASISGTALTVTGSPTGTIAIGQYLTGSNVLNGTYIVSGSGNNWVVNQSQTVSSTTITGNAFVISAQYHPFTTGQWVFLKAEPGIYTTTGTNIPAGSIGSSLGGWVIITNTSGTGASATFTVGNSLNNLGSNLSGIISGYVAFAGSVSGMTLNTTITRGPYTGTLVSNAVPTANTFDIAPSSTDIAFTLAAGSLGSPKSVSSSVSWVTDRPISYPTSSVVKYSIASTTATSGTVSAYNSIYMEVANSSTAVRVTPSTIYTGNSTANMFANSSSLAISGLTSALQLQPSQITVGTSVNGLIDPTQNAFFVNSSVFRLGGGTSKYTLMQAGQVTVYGSNLVIGTEIANISMNQSNLVISSNSIVTTINSNNATFGGDVTVTGGLIANGSYGDSGSILISTGTNTYWGNVPGLDTTQNYSFTGGLSFYSTTNVYSNSINFIDNIGNYQSAAANGISLADTNGFNSLLTANTFTLSDNNTIVNSTTITPTLISIGNSTVNTQTNSTVFFTGNSSFYSYINVSSQGVVNTSGNVTLTPTSISFSNTTSSNFFVANDSGTFVKNIITGTSVYVNSTNKIAALQVGMNDSTGGGTAWDKTYAVFGPPTLTTTTPALGIGWNSAGGYGEIISVTPGTGWNNLRLKGNLVQLYYTASGGSAETEGFRLDAASGNVGIGNTAPGDKLSINGTTYLGGNLKISTGISIIDSTGSQGTVGQVLTSNGVSNVYWSTISAAASVNTAAQYAWTNTQSFSNVVTFNGNVVMSAANNVINATSYTVGTAFVANATGVYTTGTVNAASFTTTGNANAANHYAGANAVFNSTNLLWTGNTSTSPTITLANTGAFSIGNSSTTQTTGSITVANSAGNVQITAGATSILATGIVNASAFTTTGNANAANHYAGANAVFNSTNLLWTGNTSTSPTITLSNTGAFTIGNSSTTQTTGTISVANSAGNVTITAVSVAVGSAETINATGIYTTGTVNALAINSTSYTIGSSFIANTSGVYTTGTVNAASYTIGAIVTANNNGIFTTNVVSSISHLTTGGTFVANNTALYVNSAIFLAGSNGTVGQVLTSNGTSNAYWASVTATINTAAQYSWTNTQTFSANQTLFTSTNASPNAIAGAIISYGGIAANGNVYTAGRIGYANSAGANQAYTYYNASTGSLDTVFG